MTGISVVKGLWIGDALSEIEILSIKSFQKQGHIFELFTYGEVQNIPSKTVIRDGNEILDGKEIFKFKDSYLPFSDLFRYKLMYDEGGIWVDLDMICIQPFIFKDKFIFSSERTKQKGAFASLLEETPSNNILKSDKGESFYLDLFSRCFLNRKNVKKNTQFLVYMKELISKYEYEKYVKPAQDFNPLNWWHVKEFLYSRTQDYPSKYGTTAYTREDLLKSCYSIHMWRNLIKKKNLSLDNSLSLYKILYNKIM
tara:strand:- start:252 stop:1013 length:762 start_codon:yes stop_codon:yes gene_type:complete